MSSGDVTVLTTCHPAYTAMLPQAIASMLAQTIPPAYHRISIDYRDGVPVPQLNEMALGVTTEFVSLLAADDLVDPRHLECQLSASHDADVVYTWCRVVGRTGWNPNALFDAERLRRENYIPATALIRTELVRELGYWNADSLHDWEDWDFWLRALDAGARFECVPTVTWTYRFHGANASLAGFRRRVPA